MNRPHQRIDETVPGGAPRLDSRNEGRSARRTLQIAMTLLLAGGFASGALAQNDPNPSPYRPLGPGIFRSALGSLDSSDSSSSEPPGHQVRVNQAVASASFAGASYLIGPTITPTTTVPEAEQHIAVDPNDANRLVAGISDFSQSELINGNLEPHNTTKYALSADGGQSWVEGFVEVDPATGRRTTSDGMAWEANSDPVVAIDKAGRVYMADLYFNIANKANGLYVNVDDNPADGVSFTAAQTYPVKVNPDPATVTSEDKPWITVDNSASAFSGNVYVSWTRFYTVTNTVTTTGHKTTTQVENRSGIFVSRSVDLGSHWSAPLLISQSSIQGSQITVGPNGTVYVVWFQGNQQFLSKSIDGGQSFSAFSAITPVFNSLNFSSSYRKNSWPAFAIDPTSGYLYIAWADQPSTYSRIEFIASYDGGKTFTAPTILNDSPAGQSLMPALAVDPAGTVHCSWFDTRNSPDGTAQYYDIYATYTTDRGASFAPNARVTAATINAGTAGFIGDYSGIAAADGSAHPVWNNGSDYKGTQNNGGMQTATITPPPPGPVNPDFSLSANPGSVALPTTSGSWTASYAVTVNRVGGFTEPVTLSVVSSPALPGATAQFTPNPATDNSSTLNVTVPANAAGGNYTLTISGLANPSGLAHSTQSILQISSVPTAVSVVSITYAISGGSTKTTADLLVTHTLRDNRGNAVAGATVSTTLYLNGASYGSGSGATAADGTITFTSRHAPLGAYTSVVTAVTATGLTWDGATPPNSYNKTK